MRKRASTRAPAATRAAEKPGLKPELPHHAHAKRIDSWGSLGKGFALRYAAIAGVLFALYAFPYELFGAREDWLSGYLATYARLAGTLLSIFDPGVSVSGTYIHGRYPLQIVRTCDAAEINILFVSAMLAFPAPWSRRWLPLLTGLLCLVVANVLRICCLYFIGIHVPGHFEVAHEEIWPLLLVAFTVLLFLGCVRHIERGGGNVVRQAG